MCKERREDSAKNSKLQTYWDEDMSQCQKVKKKSSL